MWKESLPPNLEPGASSGDGGAGNAPISMTRHPMTIDSQKRCQMCIDDSHGQDHKKQKDHLSKVKACCGSCGNPVCPKHKINLCQKCSNLFAPKQYEFFY